MASAILYVDSTDAATASYAISAHLLSQVKHNPFPPAVSRSNAPFHPPHSSSSSRAPITSHTISQQRSSPADAPASTGVAVARAPAPAATVFKRETISDDDEIKSEVLLPISQLPTPLSSSSQYTLLHLLHKHLHRDRCRFCSQHVFASMTALLRTSPVTVEKASTH